MPITTFEWELSSVCQGTPDSIRIIPREQSEVVKVIEQDYPLEECRYKSNVIDNTNCCYSYLGKELGLRSFAVAESFVLPSQVSTNVKYCVIRPTTKETFDTLYLLSNNNQCYQGGLKCTTQGLSVYPTNDCLGMPQVFQFNSNGATTQFNTSFQWRDGFEAGFQTLSPGPIKYQWTTFFPQRNYVPLNTSPIEIIGLCSQILTVTFSFLLMVYYSYRVLYQGAKRIYKVFALSHLLWLTYEIIDICTQYLQTDNQSLLLGVTGADYAFGNIAMLVTLLINANNVMAIVFRPKLYQMVLVHTGLTFVHIGLAGGNYFAAWFASHPPFLAWSQLTAGYWPVFMFLFDISATLIISVYIIRVCDGFKDSIWVSVQKALKEPNLIRSFAAQMMLGALYYINYHVANYTILMGSDRGDSALMFGVQNLLTALHAGISSLNYDYFSSLLKTRKGSSKAKKLQWVTDKTPSLTPSSKGFPQMNLAKSKTVHLTPPPDVSLGASFATKSSSIPPRSHSLQGSTMKQPSEENLSPYAMSPHTYYGSSTATSPVVSSPSRRNSRILSSRIEVGQLDSLMIPIHSMGNIIPTSPVGPHSPFML